MSSAIAGRVPSRGLIATDLRPPGRMTMYPISCSSEKTRPPWKGEKRPVETGELALSTSSAR